MRKLQIFFLSGLLCAANLNAQSGKTGNLFWSISGSTLTITGFGAMPDYCFDAPWQNYNASIKTVIIESGVTSISGFCGYEALTSVTIPNSVQSIGNSAFYHCTGLTSVTIPNSVISIGSQAFSHCTGLSSITIPNSVQSIGSSAFWNCNSLTSITIPNSVTSIEHSVFVGCTGLTAINVAAANSHYSSEDGVLFNKNKTILIEYPEGKQGVYNTMPYSVTLIDEGAFRSCTGLSSVTIPNSVQSIGSSAFYGCIALSSISIPNSVTSIGTAAFGGCTGLTTINVAASNSYYSSEEGVLFNKNKTTLIQYPGGKQGNYNTMPNIVTSIHNSAFVACTGLTSVIIQNSVTSIGERVFRDCAGLTSVTIPNSVTSIGDQAFWNCSSLKSITIPNGITSIGLGMFGNCSSLISITIPNSVTTIGTGAFGGCTGLKSVTIGNSVTSIGTWAFGHCISLTTVTNLSTAPQKINNMEMGAFYEVTLGNVTLYVPQSSISLYQAADVWKDFGKILAAADGIISGTVNGAPAGTAVQLWLSPDGTTKSDPAGYTLVATTTTDANGKYKFNNLPLGIYMVIVMMSGHTSQPSNPITLAKGETASDVNFTVKDGRITPDGITGAGEIQHANPLRAWVHNGLLHITGLIPGETVSIYSATGGLVHHSIATINEADISLGVQGVYIVRAGSNSVRVVYK